MLAERYGLLLANNPTPGTEEWREMTLINGFMGLHADRIARRAEFSEIRFNASKAGSAKG
jgi:hypothetical protein